MVKRLAAFLLALLVCSAAALAEGPELTLSQLWQDGFEGYELAINSAGGFETDYPVLRTEGDVVYYSIPAEELAKESQSLSPVSVSPDGAVLLEGGAGMPPMVLRGKTLVLMLPGTVEGTSGKKLEQILSRPISMMAGGGGIAWSPDGRYIAVTNNHHAVMMMQMIFEPVLWDTYTGEIVVLQSFGTKLMGPESNGAGVIDTAFDRAGEYLYCVLLEYQEDNRFTLRRYNLETREGELLFAGRSFPAYPDLMELENGRWAIGWSSISGDEPDGYHVIGTNDAWWSDQPMMLNTGCDAYAVRDSRASDDGAVVLSRIALKQQMFGGLMISRPGEDWKGLNEVWAISNEEPAVMVRTDLEVGSLTVEEVRNEWDVKTELQGQYKTILCYDISPDGTRALIATIDLNEVKLFMLDIGTMELVPVQAEGYAPEAMAMASRSSCAAGWLDWHGGDIVTLGNGEKISIYTIN